MLPPLKKLQLPSIYKPFDKFFLTKKNKKKKNQVRITLNSEVEDPFLAQRAKNNSISDHFKRTSRFPSTFEHNETFEPEIPKDQNLKFHKKRNLKINESLLNESHFSIRKSSLKRDQTKDLSASNLQPRQARKSENISKYRKSSMLKNMRVNGFSEKFELNSNFENELLPRRENPRIKEVDYYNVLTEQSLNTRPSKPRHSGQLDLGLSLKAPRPSKKREKKNFQKKPVYLKTEKTKMDKVSMKEYCRSIFKHAFSEIDSIFYLFRNLHEVGSGSYAVAYSAVEKKSGKKFVLKTFRLKNFTKKSYVSRFMVKTLFF